MTQPIDLDNLVKRVTALEWRVDILTEEGKDPKGPSLGEQIRRGFARGDVLVAISDHDDLRWRRRGEEHDEGRNPEVFEIVAWLRAMPPPWDERVDPEIVTHWLADQIEAGEHRK